MAYFHKKTTQVVTANEGGGSVDTSNFVKKVSLDTQDLGSRFNFNKNAYFNDEVYLYKSTSIRDELSVSSNAGNTEQAKAVFTNCVITLNYGSVLKYASKTLLKDNGSILEIGDGYSRVSIPKLNLSAIEGIEDYPKKNVQETIAKAWSFSGQPSFKKGLHIYDANKQGYAATFNYDVDNSCFKYNDKKMVHEDNLKSIMKDKGLTPKTYYKVLDITSEEAFNQCILEFGSEIIADNQGSANLYFGAMNFSFVGVRSEGDEVVRASADYMVSTGGVFKLRIFDGSTHQELNYANAVAIGMSLGLSRAVVVCNLGNTDVSVLLD